MGIWAHGKGVDDEMDGIGAYCTALDTANCCTVLYYTVLLP